MKKPAALCLLAIALVANISCEQQSYEETKMFNQSSKASSHGHSEKPEGGGAHQKEAPAEKHN